MKNKKPPYLLGLLCLIPLIGAFVGIGLVLYGILYYKDKWFVIIGAGGIVFTVLLYSFLFYEAQYGKAGEEGFAQIAKWDLDRLMKEIEFYKIQNGRYPDDLKQLRANNKLLSIEDPLQSRKFKDMNKSVQYNYERQGSNYYLYSSGPDGIPKTEDDIFPAIVSSDSNKIGWRRRR